MSDQHDSRFKGGLPDYLIRHTTFRQMQIFEAIVRLGSFTRAAEELFLTQPTVSTQFKKLTGVMGLPLIDQSGRKLKATDAGEELYRTIRNIFDVLSELDTSIAGLQGLRRGRLRLAVITIAKHFIPEVLGDFCSEYPNIDVALKVTNREKILERIHNNEDDLYILGQLPEQSQNLTVCRFAPNPLVVMAPRDHPLVEERNISIERLAKEPLILREVGSGIREAALNVFSEHNVSPNLRMEISSNEAIKHAVVGGLGITVSSLHVLTLEGADGPIALLDVEGFPIKREWSIVYPAEKALSEIAKTFVEFAIAGVPVISQRMDTLYKQMMAQKKSVNRVKEQQKA